MSDQVSRERAIVVVECAGCSLVERTATTVTVQWVDDFRTAPPTAEIFFIPPAPERTEKA